MASPFLKASPSGGSCRPQAADEGRVCEDALLWVNPANFSLIRPRAGPRTPSPKGEGITLMNFLHLLENIPVSWYSKVFP